MLRQSYLMLEWAKVSWSSRAICSPCAWVSTVPPNLPRRSHIQAADRLLEGLVCATASLPMRAADPQKQELHTQVPVLQCSRCTLQHLWKCREGLCVRWASLTPPTCVSACLPGSVLFLNVGQCFISLCHCLFVYSKQLQARGLGFALKWHPVVDLLRSSFAQWEGVHLAGLQTQLATDPYEGCAVPWVTLPSRKAAEKLAASSASPPDFARWDKECEIQERRIASVGIPCEKWLLCC